MEVFTPLTSIFTTHEPSRPIVLLAPKSTVLPKSAPIALNGSTITRDGHGGDMNRADHYVAIRCGI